jgi:hypothetical protein
VDHVDPSSHDIREQRSRAFLAGNSYFAPNVCTKMFCTFAKRVKKSVISVSERQDFGICLPQESFNRVVVSCYQARLSL